MNPAALIPSAEPIQAAWGWYEFLMLLTFVVHLLLMNSLLGGGIIAFVRTLRFPATGSALTDPIKDYSKKMPTLIALTVNFGVAPLLFMQVLYGQFFYVSSILIAFFWLSVVVVVILAYYSAYYYDFKFNSLQSGRIIFLGISLLLLLFVSFIFTNNTTLMLTPERWLGYFDNPTGTMLNLGEPTLFPRWLHFLTGSIAVGGLFFAVLGRIVLGKTEPNSDDEAMARVRIDSGMRWFLYATFVQLFVGVLFLVTLPREIMLLFMGGSILYTVIFLSALAMVVVSLILGFRKLVYPTAASIVITVSLMASMRELVRLAYLKPYYSPADLVLEPQYSPMIIFFIVLVLGLGVIAYMLKAAAKAGKEA